MKRTHDLFYLHEDNLQVKDSFVEVANAIGDSFYGSIADVGCATGAFPNYLYSRFPKASVFGIEYLESLLAKAKEDFPHINFLKGDVTQQSSVNEKFDVITMLGVLCIFDDYASVLENVLSWLKPNGRFVMHNMISDFDVDIFIKYKPSSKYFKSEELESGWNIISKKSLQLVCDQLGAELLECQRFDISVDLLPRTDDSLRSWTELDSSGKRNIYNATHIRQPQQIAVVKMR